MLVKYVLMALLTLFVSACSSLPEELATNNINVITDYQTWLQSDLMAENEVRIGGIVAEVANLEDRTRIEVVNMPISSTGKPDLSSEPEGRYVAYVDGYVESVALAKGRLITFLGKSAGIEKGYVGEFETQFPVIKVNNYHLWRIQERVIVDKYESHLAPCWGMHCRSDRFYSGSGRVIQEVK